MPALRPCPHPGCHDLVRSGRCQKHARPRGRESQRDRGRSWRRRRARVIARADGLCEVCGDAAATEADHKVPIWEGGADRMHNLQAICSPCHKIKTAEEATRRAKAGAA